MEDHQIETIQSYNKTASKYVNKIAKLTNYNHTYDFLNDLLKENADCLDLACGPGNISNYLLKNKILNITGYDLSSEMLKLAQKNIANGEFIKQSIIDFTSDKKFEVVINGFGLPYLTIEQALTSFKNTYDVLKNGGYFYLSFMDGQSKGYEKASFGGEERFFIHYHDKMEIERILNEVGFNILKKWELDYKEPDGSITTDIVMILKK